MRLEILGPGCKRCQLLAENARAAAREVGLAAEVVKVEDLATIMSYGVLATPALVIDGQVRSSGHLLSVAQVKALITAAATTPAPGA